MERGCNQSVSQSVQSLSWVRLFATPAYGWASLIARLVKNLRFLGWEDPLEKGRLPTPVFLGFPRGLAGKASARNVGDLGSILGLGTMQPMVSPRLVFVVQVTWCHGRWSQAIRAGLFGPQCLTSLSTVFPIYPQIH